MFRRQNGSTRSDEVDPDNPDPRLIQKAAEIIHRGGVVVFPTRSLYGLAANAFDSTAVDRIFKIKKRPSQKPVLLLIENRVDLPRVVRRVPPEALQLMDRFWPGRLTIVMDAHASLPQGLTAGTDRIGIRLTANPVAGSLIAAVGGPITGTSANISGKPGCSSISQLDPAVARKVDMILDAGTLEEGIGSTVVEVIDGEVLVVREGSISSAELKSAMA